MLPFVYSAAIFVISLSTYTVMCLLWGKGIIESLSDGLIIGAVLGVITLFACIFFLKKKHIKVYELKDDEKKPIDRIRI